MSRKKKAPSVLDPPPDRAIQLINKLMLGSQIGTFDLSDDEFDRAARSAGYRALLKSEFENPKGSDLHSLDLMWAWAGSPDGQSPRDWLGDHWHSQKPDRAVVEDRGEAGVFADHEQASWFAHFMDPDNFTLDEVVERLYW